MIYSKDIKHYYKSAIIAGKSIELRETELPVICGARKKGKGRSSVADDKDKTLNREKVLSRSRKKVRDLVNANYDCDKFITLTFEENVKDLTQAHKSFEYFCKKMRRKYSDFKYIAVPEFQKRGAVHYHVISNIPFTTAKEIQSIWGQGFIKINKIDHVDNVGAYVSKYITKENDDTRLLGRRCFYTSQNLNKPKKLTLEIQLNSLYRDLGELDISRIDTYTYENEFFGTTTVTRILLKQPYTRNNFLFPVPDNYIELTRQGIFS